MVDDYAIKASLAKKWAYSTTLHYIIVINVFRKTSITLQELNAIQKMSFQSMSENR